MGTYLEYNGLIPRDLSKVPALVRKAINIWTSQKSRCGCKNIPAYKYYGAKGIRVEYSKRQFIQWFLDNLKYNDPKKIHIGRIDHDKNYSFDNIEIQTARQNILERISRRGSPSLVQRKRVLILKNDKPFMTAFSKQDARRLTGLKSANSRYFSGLKYKKIYSFREV